MDAQVREAINEYEIAQKIIFGLFDLFGTDLEPHAREAINFNTLIMKLRHPILVKEIQ